MVLIPTFAGVLANEYLPWFTKRIKAVLPLVGVFLTTILCASPVGQVHTQNFASLLFTVSYSFRSSFLLPNHPTPPNSESFSMPSTLLILPSSL